MPIPLAEPVRLTTPPLWTVSEPEPLLPTPMFVLAPERVSNPPLLTTTLPLLPCDPAIPIPKPPVISTEPRELMISWLFAVLELPTPNEFDTVSTDNPLLPLPTVTVPTPLAWLPIPRFATLTLPPF